MKIVVFSDSHGNTAAMEAIAASEHPDLVLHLGDHDRDCDFCFYDRRVLRVRGNCDYGSNEEAERFLEFGKTKLWMTHGHLYEVKSGLSRLLAKGAEKGANLILFGHTHRPYLLKTAEYTVLNPGTPDESYGVIEMEGDVVTDVSLKTPGELLNQR